MDRTVGGLEKDGIVRIVIFCFAILSLITSVFCEVAHIKSCTYDSSTNCNVNEVRITPCKGTLKSQNCKMRKNKSTQVEVDFTPHFVSQNLSSQMFWTGVYIDLPILGLEKDACKSTNCPTEQNQMQTFKNVISTNFIPGEFEVKHLIADLNENMKCCYTTRIKITS